MAKWIVLFILVPLAVSSVLVLGMFLGEMAMWRREEKVGELMDNLAKRGEEILERERR